MALPPRRLRSAGDATLGLIRDPHHADRMAPVLRFTDSHGRVLVVELTAAEVRDLRGDADKLLDADERTVGQWWSQLTGSAAKGDGDRF